MHIGAGHQMCITSARCPTSVGAKVKVGVSHSIRGDCGTEPRAGKHTFPTPVKMQDRCLEELSASGCLACRMDQKQRDENPTVLEGSHIAKETSGPTKNGR